MSKKICPPMSKVVQKAHQDDLPLAHGQICEENQPMATLAPQAYPLTFKSGTYQSKTVEWVIFNDPGWIVNCKSHDPGEGGYGAIGQHLDRRWRLATHLRIPGTCVWCKTNSVTRIVLSQSRDYISTALFACAVCRPTGIANPIFCEPSFEAARYFRAKSDLRIFLSAIKVQYFGTSSYPLNQKRMESFFESAQNFTIPLTMHTAS